MNKKQINKKQVLTESDMLHVALETWENIHHTSHAWHKTPGEIMKMAAVGLFGHSIAKYDLKDIWNKLKEKYTDKAKELLQIAQTINVADSSQQAIADVQKQFGLRLQPIAIGGKLKEDVNSVGPQLNKGFNFSSLTAGDTIQSKFTKGKQFTVVSVGNKSAMIQNGDDGKEFEIASLRNYEPLNVKLLNEDKKTKALINLLEKYAGKKVVLEREIKKKKTLKENSIKVFDWEKYDNSDIAGASMEIMIDDLIVEAKERLNSSVQDPDEKAQARIAIKKLWVSKINEWRGDNDGWHA